jgi:hypothetical protein
LKTAVIAATSVFDPRTVYERDSEKLMVCYSMLLYKSKIRVTRLFAVDESNENNPSTRP